MTVEKDAYNFLPRFMKGLCDTVCSDLPEDDCKNRKQYAQTLCRLLVKMQATDVQSLLVTKAPETPSKTMNLMSFFSEHKVSNSVAAVAAVGDLRALRSALRGDADYTWETSHQSGFLLAAAAAAVGGYGEIVRATDSRCDERLRIEVQLTEMIERRQYYKRPTAPTDNFAAGAANLFPLKQNETSASMVLVE